MNIIDRLFVHRGARADARYQLQSVEERVIGDLGLRPKLDAANNPEHAEFVRVLGDRVRVDELKEDTLRIEREAAEHGSAALYTTGIVATVVLEAFGANQLMGSLGMESSERFLLGLALAIALVGFTYIASNRVAPTSEEEASGVMQAAKRSLMSMIILGMYSAIVVAIAVIRVESSTDDESSGLGSVAQALVLLVTAVGPAWLAEWLIRKRAPAANVRARAAIVKRELRLAERKHKQARDAINNITREGVRWDGEAARRRAVYQTHHRLESAKTNELKTT